MSASPALTKFLDRLKFWKCCFGQAKILEVLFWTGIFEILTKTLIVLLYLLKTPDYNVVKTALSILFHLIHVYFVFSFQLGRFYCDTVRGSVLLPVCGLHSAHQQLRRQPTLLAESWTLLLVSTLEYIIYQPIHCGCIWGAIPLRGTRTVSFLKDTNHCEMSRPQC